MTTATRLSLNVHHAAKVQRVCGEHGATLVIHDTDALNPRLAPNATNGLVKPFAIVFQHLITGAVFDEIADAFSALLNQLFRAPPLELQIPISECCKDGGSARHQARAEFGGDSALEVFHSQLLRRVLGGGSQRALGCHRGFREVTNRFSVSTSNRAPN
jgi:hypothetical protein